MHPVIQSQFNFCLYYCELTSKGLVSIWYRTVDPLYPFFPHPISLCSLYLYSPICSLYLSVLFCLFIIIIILKSFHMWVKSCSICLSPSDFFLFFFFFALGTRLLLEVLDCFVPVPDIIFRVRFIFVWKGAACYSPCKSNAWFMRRSTGGCNIKFNFARRARSVSMPGPDTVN